MLYSVTSTGAISARDSKKLNQLFTQNESIQFAIKSTQQRSAIINLVCSILEGAALDINTAPLIRLCLENKLGDSAQSLPYLTNLFHAVAVSYLDTTGTRSSKSSSPVAKKRHILPENSAPKTSAPSSPSALPQSSRTFHYLA